VPLLTDAGFVDVGTEGVRFDMVLPLPAAVWELFMETGVFTRQLAAVAESEHPRLRTEVEAEAEAFRRPGGLVLPHACLLAWGRRPEVV